MPVEAPPFPGCRWCGGRTNGCIACGSERERWCGELRLPVVDNALKLQWFKIAGQLAGYEWFVDPVVPAVLRSHHLQMKAERPTWNVCEFGIYGGQRTVLSRWGRQAERRGQPRCLILGQPESESVGRTIRVISAAAAVVTCWYLRKRCTYKWKHGLYLQTLCCIAWNHTMNRQIDFDPQDLTARMIAVECLEHYGYQGWAHAIRATTEAELVKFSEQQVPNSKLQKHG